MLKKSTLILLPFALMATTLLINNANATANNQATVTFKAAIVFPPCTYDVIETNVNLRCFNVEEYKMKSSSIDFTKQEKSAEWKALDNHRGIYQFNWDTKENGLAVLAVQHA